MPAMRRTLENRLSAATTSGALDDFPTKRVQEFEGAFRAAMRETHPEVGREIAEKAKNNIVALDVAETQRWRRTAATVETDWVNEMKGKNIDGAKLLSEARALIAKYQR